MIIIRNKKENLKTNKKDFGIILNYYLDIFGDKKEIITFKDIGELLHLITVQITPFNKMSFIKLIFIGKIHYIK